MTRITLGAALGVLVGSLGCATTPQPILFHEDTFFELEGIVAEASVVSLAFHASGTHQGEFLGLPATGKRVEFRGVFLQTLQDGHIVHERRIYDFTGLLIKLGVLTVKPT